MPTTRKQPNAAENDARQKLEDPYRYKSLPTKGDADSRYANPEDVRRDIVDRPTISDAEKNARPNNPREPIDRQENNTPWSIKISSNSQKTSSNLGFSKKSLKKYGALAGLISFIVGFSLWLIFNFFSIFGLDNLMSNITDKSFMRLAQVGEHRERAFMRAYMMVRLGEIQGTDGKDNIFFRAEKLKGTPFLEMYRKLRGSNFEAKMAEQGIHWTTTIREVNSRLVQPRPAKVEINQKAAEFLLEPDELDTLNSGRSSPEQQRILNRLIDTGWAKVEVFNSDADARRSLTRSIKEVTSSWSFFERKTVRKVMSSAIGIRKWSFFDKSSDRQQERAESRATIRNKIINRLLPSAESGGDLSNWIRCSVNLPDCDGAKEGSKKIERAMKRIKTAGNVVGLVLLAEAASSINEALQNHTLSKMVSIARGDQAMELFANMSIAADQPRTGELNTQEMNDLMETLGDYTKGEGYQSVVTQDMSALPRDEIPENKKREEYCSEENQNKINEGSVEAREQFVWLCDDTRIGGESTARSIEDAYNSTIGAVLNPILTIYDGITDLPILKQLAEALFAVADWVGQAGSDALMAGLSVMSLDDDAKDLGAQIGTKVMNFLGANPILNENSPGPLIADWTLQGGSYTAETTARNRGAAATNSESTAFVNKAIREDALNRQEDDKTLFEKYASLENKDSTASKALLLIGSNISSYSARGIPEFLGKTIAGAPQSILKPQSTSAQKPPNPYGAANFSGIDTYDFPEKCWNYNPLTATPQNGTNIQEILGSDNVPSEDLTWGLVLKSQDWYKYIDKKIGDRDDKAEIAAKIYNCNLLDSSVRSAMAGIFGYSEDDDMPEGEQTEDQATLASGDDQALAKQIIDSGKVTGDSRYMGQIQAYANGNTSCHINSTILQLLVSMIDAGYSMHVSSLNRKCTGVLTESGEASYHYADGGGHAIDFSMINGQAVDGANGTSIKFLKDAVKVLPSGSGIGQSGCRSSGVLNLPNGVTEFSDTCNHIHIQVPKQ